MRRFQTAFLNGEGDAIATDNYSARNIAQAVALARRRAPKGASRLSVVQQGGQHWEGPVNVQEVMR